MYIFRKTIKDLEREQTRLVKVSMHIIDDIFFTSPERNLILKGLNSQLSFVREEMKFQKLHS